jgi:hypothetical protein
MKNEIERRVDDVKFRRDSLRDQLRNPSLPNPSLTSSSLSRSSQPPELSGSGTSQDDFNKGPEDFILKVVCKYRAELFFKVTRKTKLNRIFRAWTARMNAGSDSKQSEASVVPAKAIDFMFSYNGVVLDGEQTPEEVGIEGDEILVAVEIMDLTDDEVRCPRASYFD